MEQKYYTICLTKNRKRMTITEMKNIAFHAWMACRSLIESGFDADFNSYWEARENTLKERYIFDPLDQPDSEG